MRSSGAALALALLVPGIRGANDSHDPLALDDLALDTDWLDRRANFHDVIFRRDPGCLVWTIYE